MHDDLIRRLVDAAPPLDDGQISTLRRVFAASTNHRSPDVSVYDDHKYCHTGACQPTWTHHSPNCWCMGDGSPERIEEEQQNWPLVCPGGDGHD